MDLKDMRKNDLMEEIRRLRDEVFELRESSFQKDNLIQKNSLLASIVESSQDAIIGLTASLTIVSWNKAAAKMFGHTLNEVYGHHAFVLVPPERHEQFAKLREDVLLGQHIPHFRTTRLKKSGGTFPAIVSVSPIFSAKREIVGMSEMVRDITVQKDMEAALLRNQTKYLSIFENAVDGIFQITEQGRCLKVNPAYVKMFGYSSEEEVIAQIPDVSRHVYANRQDRAKFIRLMRQYGAVTNFETEARKKDGTPIWISINARAVKDIAGRTVFHEGTVEDITKRKHAEMSFILEKKISDSIINSLPGIFYLFDNQLKYKRWNNNLEKITGYSAEELSRMKSLDVHAVEARELAEESMRKCFEEGETSVELELVTKDGRSIPYVFTGRSIIIDDTPHLVGVGIDISERRKAEEAAKEREEKYRRLFELESDAIFLVDSETGRILEANNSASSLYGYNREELLRMRDVDLSAEQASTIDNVRPGMRVVPLRYHKKKGGAVFPVEIAVTHTIWNGRKFYLAAVRDISDRRKAEEALARSEEDYRSIYDNAMVGIFQSLPEGRYLRVNPALAGMHGFESPDEMITTVTNIGEQLYVNPEDRKRYMELSKNADRISRFEAPLYRKDGSTIYISMNARSVRREDGTVAYHEGIVEDITERKIAQEKLEASTKKLRKSLAATIEVISIMLETRDPYTGGHQKRVSTLARALAQEMGLPKDSIDSIRMAGIIHDIGKMSVPAEILVKPGRLSNIEMELLKVHPQTGYDILKVVELPPLIAEIVLQHHERLDGSGYPQGLKGPEVLIEAQVMAIADVVEAMSSHRPYRPALGIDAALREIENGRGTVYHPEAVDACLRLFRTKGFRFG